MLDVISFCILCSFLKYKPHVALNSIVKNFVWGSDIYDNRLFVYNDIVLVDSNTCKYYIESPNPALSSCPYNVYLFIKNFIPEITFEEVSNKYSIYAKHIIQPSSEVVTKLPIGIENAYGIHLRKTDKVTVNKTSGIGGLCENTNDEFNLVINALLIDLKNIVLTEHEPYFLFVSEDYNFREEIKQIIKTFAEENQKNINILNIDYTDSHNFSNYASIMDMWALSRCKKIFQGVKFSTFSILASLLGSCKIINYSKIIENKINLIDVWTSVIEVNNFKIFDEKYHSSVSENFQPLVTNIT
jgi:hypothetical protein